MIDRYKNFARKTLSTYDLEEFGDEFKDIEANVLQSITAEIESTLTDLNSPKTKEIRHKFFKIPNTRPEDYTEHLLTLNDVNNESSEKNDTQMIPKQVICGIRHMNRNPDIPFVNISTNFECSIPELKQIYQEQLAQYFAVFNPIYLSYHTKEKTDNKLGSCYLVQKASVIKAIPKHSNESEMTLIEPTNSDYYDWYVNGYNEFYETHPSLKESVPTNDLKLMESCREMGLLKLVEYKGKQIGLIAANKDEFLGKEALYFIELFIEDAHTGLGLAKSLQRKFIDASTVGHEMVWGTIDYENVRSFKTALSNKRRLIRYENFVEL